VRGILVHRFKQNGRDAFQVRQNVIVPEAQDGEPLSAKPSIACSIRTRVGMLSSINFDDDALLEGEKVRNVAAERHLPAELGAREAPAAQ
jgi:hypothetical protein